MQRHKGFSEQQSGLQEAKDKAQRLLHPTDYHRAQQQRQPQPTFQVPATPLHHVPQSTSHLHHPQSLQGPLDPSLFSMEYHHQLAQIRQAQAQQHQHQQRQQYMRQHEGGEYNHPDMESNNGKMPADVMSPASVSSMNSPSDVFESSEEFAGVGVGISTTSKGAIFGSPSNPPLAHRFSTGSNPYAHQPSVAGPMGARRLSMQNMHSPHMHQPGGVFPSPNQSFGSPAIPISSMAAAGWTYSGPQHPGSLDSAASSFQGSTFGSMAGSPPGAYGEDQEDGHQKVLQNMFEKRRRRRESHNAVERRRRDNINEKIQELCSLIPETMFEVAMPSSPNQAMPPQTLNNPNMTTTANGLRPNKGAILRKSVEFIKGLQCDLDSYKSLVEDLSAVLDHIQAGGQADIDAAKARIAQVRANSVVDTFYQSPNEGVTGSSVMQPGIHPSPSKSQALRRGLPTSPSSMSPPTPSGTASLSLGLGIHSRRKQDKMMMGMEYNEQMPDMGNMMMGQPQETLEEAWIQ